jgi:hypothetical protein
MLMEMTFADWLGVLGFGLGVVNGVGGLIAWHLTRRTKMTVRVATWGKPGTKTPGVTISAINQGRTVTVEHVELNWEGTKKIVPNRFWGSPARRELGEKFRAEVQARDMAANGFRFPGNASARVTTEDGDTFESPVAHLDIPPEDISTP